MNVIEKGDILSGTWGYGITIPRWAIVEKVTPKTVVVTELEKQMVQDTDGGYRQMGYEMPVKPFVRKGKPLRRAKRSDNYWGEYIEWNQYSMLSKWDGKPIHANYMD